MLDGGGLLGGIHSGRKALFLFSFDGSAGEVFVFESARIDFILIAIDFDLFL